MNSDRGARARIRALLKGAWFRSAGTDLGVAIVAEIARLHRGRIEASARGAALLLRLRPA